MFNACGSTISSMVPGNLIWLDQANDITDTGGDYICGPTPRTGCTAELNPEAGRLISGTYHSQVQATVVAGVTNNGGGNYTVTVSPGVYFNNIRTSQAPGAWWELPNHIATNDGLENVTVNQQLADMNVTSSTGFTVGHYLLGATSNATALTVSIGSATKIYARHIQGTFTAGETIEDTATRGGPPTGPSTTLNSQATYDNPIAIEQCYQCWVKNVRSLHGGRNHIGVFFSAFDVSRDSYLYQAQSYYSKSYGMELEQSSGVLIENNILQQTTGPIVFGQGTGYVVSYNYSINISYNYSINNIYDPGGVFTQASYYSHDAGNNLNLWEGNNMNAIWCDSIHGSSTEGTLFRNMLNGWQTGKTEGTYPISLTPHCRGYNLIGNVMGQPRYHTFYESYATSTTGGVNGGDIPANHSIYDLGWTEENGVGACQPFLDPLLTCDPLIRSTLMRWGNYDVVTNGTQLELD